MGSHYPAGLSLPTKDSGLLASFFLSLSRSDLSLVQMNPKASGSWTQWLENLAPLARQPRQHTLEESKQLTSLPALEWGPTS